MKNFDLYALCRKVQGGFGLEKMALKLRLGRINLPEMPGVRLIGGFPGLFQETDVPVSPSLQLNGDLARFSAEELLSIARAELYWKDHVFYRSLMLEPDPRVAVLSGSADALSAFMDIWGGVLEITPVLTRGYHPDFISASQVEIRQIDQGLRLILSVKSPFDLERCTYCALCGPACPEACLRENLFLDFDACTFCGACVSACPNNAIDLHAVEMVDFEVPALLLLPDAGVDMATDMLSVYRQDQLQELISTICARQVEEVISLDSSRCQFSRRPGAGCSRCLEVCPSSALYKGEDGLEIDHIKCVECGACVSVCPTGALQYERFNDKAFSAHCAQLDLHEGLTIVIGHAEALHAFWWKNRTGCFDHTFFMEYPEIGAISVWHLLLLMARGAGQVLLLGHDDQGPGVLSGQVALANRIMETLFGVKEPVRLVSVKDASMFMETGRKALKEKLPPSSFRGRRQDLARILSFLVEHGYGKGRVDPQLSDSFGNLVCDTARCTQCLACLNECRQEALRAEEASFVVSFEPSLCVQCGICANVCPEGALRLEPGLVLERQFFERGVLAEAEPARCKGCGKIFGTRKSLEKVREILSDRDDLDLELFEYCEDCRVKRFFEQEASGDDR